MQKFKIFKWKDILNIKNGKDYKSISTKKGTYPIYGSGGIIGYVDEYLCNENSVVVGRKGTINNPLFVKEKFWNIDTAFGLEAKQDKLEPLFLYYFCLNFDFLQLNTATTLPSLTKSKLQEIQIPLPPLEEQRRIVEVLDGLFAKIDASIALLDANISSATSLMPSALNEVFEELGEKWEKKFLKDISLIQRGKSKHRPRNDPKLYGGKYPFFQTGDVRNANKYLISYQNTYSDFGLSQSKLWKKGIVCITIAANIGDVALLGIDGCFPDSVIGIDSQNNSNEYIYYFLLTLKAHLESQATTTAQMNINQKILEQIEIPLPPLDIQAQAVAYLDALHVKAQSLKKVQQTKKEELLALKASLLKSAFKGEL